MRVQLKACSRCGNAGVILYTDLYHTSSHIRTYIYIHYIDQGITSRFFVLLPNLEGVPKAFQGFNMPFRGSA